MNVLRTICIGVLAVTLSSYGYAKTPRNSYNPIGKRGAGWLCNTVAFSPDGRTLATVCGSTQGKPRVHALNIYNVDTGLRLAEVEVLSAKRLLTGTLGVLEYSPDGSMLAFAEFGSGFIPFVWNSSTFELLPVPEIPEDQRYSPTALSFSPDSRFLAVGDVAGRIHIHAVDGPDDLTVLEVENSQFVITALAFSRDGTALAAAVVTDAGPAVRIWDWREGGELLNLEHSAGVTSIAVDPHRSRMYTFSGELTAWDLVAGDEIPEEPESVTAAQRLGQVAAGTVNITASVLLIMAACAGYACGGGRSVLEKYDQLPRLALSLDGSKLAVPPVLKLKSFSGFFRPKIIILDTETLEEIQAIAHPSLGLGPNNAMALSPTGEQLAIVGYGVRLYDTSTGKEVRLDKKK